MPIRSGTVIISCLGLAAILVVLGYGFLRSTMQDIRAGSSSHHFLLAQSAATMGTARATEAIVADYARATVTVNQGHGGSTTINAVTFLDGTWRAPYVSLWKPNRLYRVDANQADKDDDVSAETNLIIPLLTDTDSDQGPLRHTWFTDQGNQIYDGRGRYLEPGFHYVSDLPPAGSASKPVEITRFTDLAAAVPERNEGLYLDHDFGRIDTGSATDDRLSARYRLRFAIGIEDLGGHLLGNPYPEGDYDWRSPTAAYRDPPPWLDAAQHAFANMAQSQVGPGPTAAVRWEHVFLGRGNASNVDRRPSSGGPMTYPAMFRHAGLTASGNPLYWGLYSANPNPSVRPRRPTDRLYPIASLAGGEPLPAITTTSTPILAHNYGPQISWVNQRYVIQGYLGGVDDATYGTDHAASVQATMLSITPYGRRLEVSTAAPADWRWYQGRVETPFYVNLLTATPRTVHAMLIAYLPPSVKSILLQVEEFYPYTGKNLRDIDTWGPRMARNVVSPGTPVALGGRDLFTNLAGPAFSYVPPSADGITPNFYKPDLRGPEQRYPGRIWNVNDDLGKDIDVDAVVPLGRCTHTNLPFLFNFWSENTLMYGAGVPVWTSTPPPGWGTHPMDKVEVLPDSDTVQRYTFADSYWWDLVMAFTTSIGTARAAWVQYPTPTFNPYVDMDASLHDPEAYDTLEEIDRLFLQQLGEDFDTPGSAVIPTQVTFTPPASGNRQHYRTGGKASHSIRTLFDSGRRTPAQANVMERVLNDMRLSFLGASPQYSETFRPKDFSGDGKVHCSAYPRHGTASLSDEEEGIAWWMAADASGNGPAPEHWFSLSGCFYIGKSHYYRVFSRGEVWDNLSRSMVSGQTLESVICVDPSGNDPDEVHTLYQRWIFDPNTSTLPRHLD